MRGDAMKVLKVLREGPATSKEIAAELDMPIRRVQVAIWILRKRVHCVGRIPSDEHKHYPLKLWEKR